MARSAWHQSQAPHASAPRTSLHTDARDTMCEAAVPRRPRTNDYAASHVDLPLCSVRGQGRDSREVCASSNSSRWWPRWWPRDSSRWHRANAPPCTGLVREVVRKRQSTLLPSRVPLYCTRHLYPTPLPAPLYPPPSHWRRSAASPSGPSARAMAVSTPSSRRRSSRGVPCSSSRPPPMTSSCS